jgi:hypothetical protein
MPMPPYMSPWWRNQNMPSPPILNDVNRATGIPSGPIPGVPLFGPIPGAPSTVGTAQGAFPYQTQASFGGGQAFSGPVPGPGGNVPNNFFELPTGGGGTPPPNFPNSVNAGSDLNFRPGDFGGSPNAITTAVSPNLTWPNDATNTGPQVFTPTDTGNFPTPPGVPPDVARPTWFQTPFSNGMNFPSATTPWHDPTNWANMGNMIRNFFSQFGQPTNWANVTNPFTTNPFPNIAPGGSPIGSFTPDPVFRGGALPGTPSQFGGGGGNLGSMTGSISRGIWGGNNPYTPENYNNMLGWMNYNRMTGMAGMSYPDYLSTWHSLRSSGATDPRTQTGVAAGGWPGGTPPDAFGSVAHSFHAGPPTGAQ